VQRADIAGMRDFRRQIAFDTGSFDPEAGYCTTVYWSRIEHDDANYGRPEPDPAIYRSSDGGQTWSRLPDSRRFAGGELIAHPGRPGTLYAANDRGVFVSDDGATSWQQLHDAPASSLHVAAAAPDRLWVTGTDRLIVSRDGGQTWDDVPALREGDDRQGVRLRMVSVSPADPDRLLVASTADHWRFASHVSHDAGVTWRQVELDPSLAFLPQNARRAHPVWSPADPDVALSFGGDWPTRSADGGSTFHWFADGVNTVLVGGAFQFNPGDPDLMFCGSQDYNGAFTRNAGRTWTYSNVSGHSWGGFTYGGVAADASTFIVGLADSWDADRVVQVSRDAGQTWTRDDNARWSTDRRDTARYGHDRSFVAPQDSGVVFAGPWRSEDGGRHWQRMTGCHGVFTASPHAAGHRLWGVSHPAADRSQVVYSDDAGRTWQPRIDVDGWISDIAHAPEDDRLYLVLDHVLHVHVDGQLEQLSTPATAEGRTRISSVAVDPQVPTRLYAAQHFNTHAPDVSAMRSEDAGQTWTVISQQTPLDADGLAGGREAIHVRVHPRSGEAWFTTSCSGMWRYIPTRSEQRSREAP
jgi:photosystem II stability/assembly factor-like uncharacterized protein